MVALVTVESVLLILFCFLLVGLMRSHAEILKWMATAPQPAQPQMSRGATVTDLPFALPDRGNDAPAPEIVGRTLDNRSLKISFNTGRNTLLAFLSSGCATCRTIWEEMKSGINDDLPETFDLVVVTRDRNQESPSKLASLLPGDAALAMSSDAWEDYQIPRHPYFVYIAGSTGTIIGEGAAESWKQVISLLSDFFVDLALPGDEGEVSRPLSRVAREDADLAAAGIYPGHPSLFAPPFADGAEPPPG
jgi:hypothetical protein